jgi:signal-transduction protein with cAMP-binding, CBS, and nucleotidyltransferase domain
LPCSAPARFFGERALLGNEPRTASVRARTPLRVLVMGKNVFTQFSGALAPFRDALAQALNRRSVDVWKDQPEVYQLLKETPIKELMEPVPQPLLKPTATLREVGRAFVAHGNEFFYVSADGQTLDGVITITDLLRGRSTGATGETVASEFMTKQPIKSLPIVELKENRKLVGCLRARRLMAFLLKDGATGPEKPQSVPEVMSH